MNRTLCRAMSLAFVVTTSGVAHAASDTDLTDIRKQIDALT